MQSSETPSAQVQARAPMAGWIGGGLAVAAAILRLFPLAWNFSPVGGLALFSGARMRSWQAFAVPVASMLASNAALAWLHGNSGEFFYPTAPFVFLAFAISVCIGRTLSRSDSPWKIGCASLLASLQFFLLTNFGQWLLMGYPADAAAATEFGRYPWSLTGLLACYENAIPFLR